MYILLAFISNKFILLSDNTLPSGCGDIVCEDIVFFNTIYYL